MTVEAAIGLLLAVVVWQTLSRCASCRSCCTCSSARRAGRALARACMRSGCAQRRCGQRDRGDRHAVRGRKPVRARVPPRPRGRRRRASGLRDRRRPACQRAFGAGAAGAGRAAVRALRRARTPREGGAGDSPGRERGRGRRTGGRPCRAGRHAVVAGGDAARLALGLLLALVRRRRSRARAIGAARAARPAAAGRRDAALAGRRADRRRRDGHARRGRRPTAVC